MLLLLQLLFSFFLILPLAAQTLLLLQLFFLLAPFLLELLELFLPPSLYIIPLFRLGLEPDSLAQTLLEKGYGDLGFLKGMEEILGRGE